MSGRMSGSLLSDRRTVPMPFLIGDLCCEDQIFQETDTPYIEFRAVKVAETKAFEETPSWILTKTATFVVFITLQHAHERADISHFSMSRLRLNKRAIL